MFLYVTEADGSKTAMRKVGVVTGLMTLPMKDADFPWSGFLSERPSR
jgi:hypothetical protein